MDVLTVVMAYALGYAVMSKDYSTPATANWTAINETTWWGPADQEANQDTTVYPANITFSDEMILDLKERLRRNITYVAPLEDSNFEYGFNRDQLANWTTYWAEEYDFKAREEYLNQFPMYKTNIQGIEMFFIRITPENTEGKEVVSLLMLHGFPGSLREFYDAIPLLTAENDKDYVLELIIPCLPGFGYSTSAVRKNMGAVQCAVILRSLMQRLGIQKYYLQGGDFGSIIASHLSTLFPDEVLGFHCNWAQLMTPVAVLLQLAGQFYPSFIVEESLIDRMYPVYDIYTNIMGGTGYLHFQATKPDTLGIAMTDSPGGLLAYHLENMARVYDSRNIEKSDGGLYDMFTQEMLMDNMMFYWAPQSTTGSMRLYSNSFNMDQFGLKVEEIICKVPYWIVQTKYEISYQSPLILGMKWKNILNTTVLDHGGHFFAAELPETFADSVLTAISAFREWHAENSS